MKYLLSLLLLLCSLDASALYYCKCDTGAHASCPVSAGSDALDGTTAANAKSTPPTATELSNAAAGTTHYFCQGGAWTGLSTYVVQNNNVTRTQPLTLTTYAPASGATGRPIFEWLNTQAEGFVLGFFNNDSDHGGYTLDGIEFRRAGSAGGEGLKLFGQASYVLYNNIKVTNWANGMVPSTSQGVHHVTLRNSLVQLNVQNGIIGNVDDFLIESNTFDQNNYDGSGGEHAIYIGGCEARNRVTIRRNTFTNNSVTGGQCTSGNITTRGGNTVGLTVEENDIEVPYGNDSCYGISVIDGYPACTEHVENLVVRGNTVKNVGSNSIAVLLCTNCLIENNRVIRDSASNTGLHTAISVGNPSTPEDAAVSPATGATIRNNSIYIASGSLAGSGISVSAGSGHKVLNNVVQITAAVTGAVNCFSHTALSNFTVWDNNWCYEQGSGQWSGTYATLASAQAAGFDANGGNTNPLWVSTPSVAAPTFATQSGSPLRSAGRNTDKAKFDAAQCLRDSTPDVGAMEAGGTPCLTFRAPVELR